VSDRGRSWQDELSDLLSDEVKDQLSRARRSLARKRKERAARDARQREEDLAQQARQRASLERELAGATILALERRYAGLGNLPLALMMALGAAASAAGGIFIVPAFVLPLLTAAIGLGMGGAGLLSSYVTARRKFDRLRVLRADGARDPAGSSAQRAARALGSSSPPPQPAFVPDPLEERIEKACGQLEQAMREAPPDVREAWRAFPQQTLTELRASARSFQERERQLRASSGPEVKARVQADAEALQQRFERTTDEAVRTRLGRARSALAMRQSQLEALQRSADRLEAERIRLSHTLDGLLTQFLQLRFSDEASREAIPTTLRDGLGRLSQALTALAEASEAVGRVEDRGAEVLGPLSAFEEGADGALGSLSGFDERGSDLSARRSHRPRERT